MHRLLAGGVSRQGLVVEGAKGVKYAPSRLECTKTVKKQPVSALVDLKMAKTPFFT
jgi:hypothetical protein